MKILNTPENKAKFFALYWGQAVMTYNDEILKFNNAVSNPAHFYVSMFNIDFIENKLLRLRQLSSITDDEAIEVAKFSGFDFDEDTERAVSYDTTLGKKTETDYLINRGKSTIKLFLNKLNYKAYQYLQSLGFAIPYHDLSVDDLIAYGWIKLTK